MSDDKIVDIVSKKTIDPSTVGDNPESGHIYSEEELVMMEELANLLRSVADGVESGEISNIACVWVDREGQASPINLLGDIGMHCYKMSTHLDRTAEAFKSFCKQVVDMESVDDD